MTTSPSHTPANIPLVRNVVLIGMPGCGKSTAGVLLAKALSRNFVDTDLVIQSEEGCRLQDIIREQGMARFRELEERYVLGLDCAGHVIATGGSVVYSAAAMAHLKTGGVAAFIDLPLALIRRRVDDMDRRGVVRAPGQTIEALYAERLPLYRRYADLTIAAEGLTHEDTVQRIIEALDRADHETVPGCRKMK